MSPLTLCINCSYFALRGLISEYWTDGLSFYVRSPDGDNDAAITAVDRPFLQRCSRNPYYPHMPTGKVWIYRLLCLYGYGFLRR